MNLKIFFYEFLTDNLGGDFAEQSENENDIEIST